MDYDNCKIYHDGSHYIAIPYEPQGDIKKKAPDTEVVWAEWVEEPSPAVEKSEEKIAKQEDEIIQDEQVVENEEKTVQQPTERRKTVKTYTKKDVFNELCKNCEAMTKSETMNFLIDNMWPFCGSRERAEAFVVEHLEKRKNNALRKKIRLRRKIDLQQDFSYFCTFTYDSKKHTEQSFKEKLKDTFKKFCSRKGWKYAGVWERGDETERLHFHGLFYIPEKTLPGELIKVRDYDIFNKRMQDTIQSTYFNERFGRSTFRLIENPAHVGLAFSYMTKYIEKTGERIVCSRNLPQYFYSDIKGYDIVCDCGIDGRKKVLFDDFSCFQDGKFMGKVSKATIAKLRKGN